MTKLSVKSSAFLSSSFALLALGAFSSQANAAILPLENWEIFGSGSQFESEYGDSLFLSTEGGVESFDAEDFLGLSSGTIPSLGSPTTGSVAKTTITANAGDEIQFKWLFQAGDYLPYNDFSFYSVVKDTSEGFLLADVAQVGDYGQGNGFQTYTFATPGTYVIGFGVFNSVDNALQSSLSVEPVPEPLTMLGAATAISLGASFKRKLAKKQEKENSSKA
ncbi:hypothetical protein PCC7424_5137 [Gloeothece citriformis PCC 7424]|uniref:PEP-CTERM protein-sorting domain-containing protein n=1 Tax=Gloeothece citriformis (strain PCC 7424) TaxID=65393 RepID=B7KH00_GLOC7|nr:PEP-CTERM sorting domain-containing protein [Gloeothece citriformis]ACK73487.1 hypothetical protein PCC7424_5137 [Gloeothece citriformis PCC 7424]